jgi:hypothetical protein
MVVVGLAIPVVGDLRRGETPTGGVVGVRVLVTLMLVGPPLRNIPQDLGRIRCI